MLAVERSIAAGTVVVSDELPALHLDEFVDARTRAVQRLDNRAIPRPGFESREQAKKLDLFQASLGVSRHDPSGARKSQTASAPDRPRTRSVLIACSACESM